MDKGEQGSIRIFGFLRDPPGKGSRLGSAYDWARAKSLADIPEEADRSLWRIHNDLYDLSKFDHPGGQDWIDVTRGNDITELVESSHPNIEKICKLLPKYKAKSCDTKKDPRNSGAFTFEKNGFYATFRDRAWKILKDVGTGPTTEMLLIHDGLLLAFLAISQSMIHSKFDGNAWIFLAIVAGFVLQCLGTCSHNFYHKKPNWRMYTWDITPYSSYEWKISHAYSHHTFPNTAYDYEVSVFEPFLLYLPEPKGFIRLLTTPLVLLLLSLGGMHLQALQRYARILVGKQRMRWEHSIPFLLLLVLSLSRYYTSAQDGQLLSVHDKYFLLKQAFRLCFLRLNVVYIFASLFFHNISLGAGHHNPLIWHQGDKIVENLDWGIFQIVSVARFEAVDRNLLLTSVSFGNHALHHLMPTVDHSKLPFLLPTFIETCKEFGIDFNDDWFLPRDCGILFGWVAMIKQAFRTTPSDKNFPFHLKKL